MGDLITTLAAIGAAGTIGKKLFDAACYGIKRFLEPYFIAHKEKVAAKTELTVFRENPLKQLEFAQEFLKNFDGRFPSESVAELANICSVVKTAVGCTNGLQLDVETSPYSEAENKEWYARFFDEVRYISDEELQYIWGRLMAERIIHPQGVNNRVLYFMRDLDKCEMEAIRRSMRIFLNDDFTPDYIIDQYDSMPHDIPILLSLGIIYRSPDPFHPLLMSIDLDDENLIKGKGYDFQISAIGNEKNVEVQCYGLSPEGKVLCRLCDSMLTEGEAKKICDHLNACWQNKVKVEMILSVNS